MKEKKVIKIALNLFCLVMLLNCGFHVKIYSQQSTKGVGELSGNVFDDNTKEPLIGATIVLVGSYYSAPTDLKGDFLIKDIHPGDYTIKISYIGYADKVYNGFRIRGGEQQTLNISMIESQNTLGEVVVEGEKNLVDLESGKSKFKIGAEDIKEMNVRDIQQLVALQPGVNLTPDGLQIRGGRVYETSYIVDGVNAQDPLAGNGFGVGLSSNSIQDLTLITGGAGAEYGNAVSGVVAARVKEGGQKLIVNGSWISDKPGSGISKKLGWNTDIGNINISGPIPGLKKKVTFFISADMNLTDDYTVYPNGDPNTSLSTRYKAKQLTSSLFDSPEKGDTSFSKVFAPRQDNKWANTFKLAYTIRKGMKLTVTNQHSLNINQNTKSLQVIGFDQIFTPGFQYDYALKMDNATTYTQQTNLSVLNFRHLFSKMWSYEVALGRLTTNLRADANGRPFRPETVDRVYDPESIVTNPVTVFNPNSNVVFVNPGSGLINNNGVSPKWHDHFVEEYSINWKLLRVSSNGKNIFTFGQLHKEQYYQWLDVTSPWVGAPLQLPNGSFSKPISLGSHSDYWKVQPADGGFYATEELRYKGIIATMGLRLNYWTFGSFVDQALSDPNVIADPHTKNDYLHKTTPLLGRRYQARLLPNINVSFPVTDNNVLFFNYSHSMRMYQHPLNVYQGLNPNFQANSLQTNAGNPALSPETTVSYEIGLKSQITKNAALTVTAYYNDKFDYIVSRNQTVYDRTGQAIDRQIWLNQDYARIRGIEAIYNQRISKSFRASLVGTYQIATGQSNSALESRLGVITQGFVGESKEQYLIWDVPFTSKLNIIFTPDSTWKIGRVSLKGFRFFLTASYKTNSQRYSPYVLSGTTDYGRPIYVKDPNRNYTELSAPVFYTDIKVSRDIFIKKKSVISITLEIKNLFNNVNPQAPIDPIRGNSYHSGDLLPNQTDTQYSGPTRDPRYLNPQDSGLPPYNPARFLQPRQLLLGVAFSI